MLSISQAHPVFYHEYTEGSVLPPELIRAAEALTAQPIPQSALEAGRGQDSST
jgi:hypothetical protein